MMSTRRSAHRLIAISTIALAIGCAALTPALAQTADSPKIASDLRPYATAVLSTLPVVPWAKSISGKTYVQVLIVSGSSDSTLASLRQDIIARKGTVLYNYITVRALAATVAASDLGVLAARTDVQSIVPNRTATRQGSLLQDAVGAG